MRTVRLALSDLRQNLRSKRRFLLACFASVLFVIGLIGVFIPLIPSAIILGPALLILSIYSPAIHAFLKRRTQKHPRMQSLMDRARNWLIHYSPRK